MMDKTQINPVKVAIQSLFLIIPDNIWDTKLYIW